MKLFPEATSKGIGYAILRVLLSVYVIFGCLLYLRQDAYIFMPPRTLMEDCPKFSDAEIVSIDGTRAYFLKSGTGARIAVIYHGNASTACSNESLARIFVRDGWNVLSVEYAGYAGDTSRSPSVALLKNDVQSVTMWLQSQSYTDVLVVGRSIGTGFASYHASLAPPDKLLLISPFDSLLEVARRQYPMYPVRWLLKKDLNNVENAATARSVLIVHGANDVNVPLARGKSLFDQLPQTDKQFVPIPDYEHNDLLDSPEAWRAINTFLNGSDADTKEAT